MKIHVESMQGIGDNIYARPFVKMLIKQGHEVFLRAGTPGIYRDLNVKFVLPEEIKYRTQQAHFDQISDKIVFHPLPTDIDKKITYHYGAPELKVRAIIPHMEDRFGFKIGSTDYKMDLPDASKELAEYAPLRKVVVGKQKIAVIRPATVRKEFPISSRNAEPNYLAWCARILKDCGYYVITLADCVENVDWIEGQLPPADLQLHQGELGLLGTFELLRFASVVIGSPGFITPAAIAAGVPLFTIFGGRGRYDNPHNLFDLRLPMHRIGWAMPDNFCRCNVNYHSCDKTISDLDHQFYSFMRTL